MCIRDSFNHAARSGVALKDNADILAKPRKKTHSPSSLSYTKGPASPQRRGAVVPLWLRAMPFTHEDNAFLRQGLLYSCLLYTSLGLDDGVIGIRDLRRAVRHDQDGIVLALLRKLRRKRLDGLCHIVGLALLALPVHQRRAERHLLELVLVVVVDAEVVVVLLSLIHISS